MKIVLVIPTMMHGGAERVMSELANEWASRGHEIHLVLLVGGQIFYNLNGDIHIHNLGFNHSGPVDKIINEIKVFFKLRNKFIAIRPGFVLSFMTKYNIFTILASRFLNLKVFISDRNNPLIVNSFPISLLRKLTYRLATGIIAQTNLAKEIAIKTNNKNIKVIPNPIRTYKAPTFEIKRENLIINVGRLVPEKGQKYLIEAFAKVKKINWKLVILGEGPLRDELEQQAIRLGISNEIFFMPGSVKDVDLWLAKASIFAFPSLSEGFPNALVEAMSAGLPCVSFDCDSGPRDIIKNGRNGFLIQKGNSQLMGEKLEVLMNNANLRDTLGNEAAKSTLKFELRKISNEYLDFCNNVKDSIWLS